MPSLLLRLFAVGYVAFVVFACNSVTAQNGSAQGRGQQQGADASKPGASAMPLPQQHPVVVDPLAAPGMLALPRAVPDSPIAFDYPGTFSRVSPTAAVMRLFIQSGPLKEKTQVVVQGQIHSLKASRASIPLQKTVAVNQAGIVDFPVDGLQPETAYRIDNITLTDAQNSGASAQIDDSYYAVTGGSTPLAQARRQLVTKALSEAYDWDHNNYDRTKRYTENAPGGWCDQFYAWAVNGIFDLQYPDDYSPDWYQQHNAMMSGAQILPTASRESIHGDLVREIDHTFMILSYDADERALWTVEGNFNDRVERYERDVNGLAWSFGHLNASMIKN